MKGINVQWKAIFPGHLLQSTAAGISDHCPLVLSLNSNLVGKRRFHFEPFWPTLEGFQEVVQQAWTSTAHTGCPIERLDAKIRATARTLQAWSQKKVGNVMAQPEQARDLLHHLEVAQDRWSRLDWLLEGDANTSFFHAHARYRERKNNTARLQVGDQLLTSHDQMETTVWDFYTGLMGTAQQRATSLNLQAFYQPTHDLHELDAPISEQEVTAPTSRRCTVWHNGHDGCVGKVGRLSGHGRRS